MSRKLIQVNCREGKGIDVRQANAVKKYRPRVILLEYSNNDKYPSFSFNKYSAKQKPIESVRKIQNTLKKVAGEDPWVFSDIQMWENIVSEWKSGNNLLAYKVDGPTDLVTCGTGTRFKGIPRHIKWWVRIYLREQFMLKNIKYVLKKHLKEEQILVFLQSFHWDNVKFLLNDPPRSEVWNRYFGRFKKLNKIGLEKKIKDNSVLLKYWKRYSNF